MIDKSFWNTIAENWKTKDDGITVPKIAQGAGAETITEEDLIPFDSVSDEEIDDILADLGLDI